MGGNLSWSGERHRGWRWEKERKLALVTISQPIILKAEDVNRGFMKFEHPLIT